MAGRPWLYLTTWEVLISAARAGPRSQDSDLRTGTITSGWVPGNFFGDEVDVIYAVADSRGFGWFEPGKFFWLPCHRIGVCISGTKHPGKGGYGALRAYYQDSILTRVSWRGHRTLYFCTCMVFLTLYKQP
ncbi:hypothetical protein F5B21DRAFT_157 [Xylaria acuta]|nr:hypothetical protein F5B21DRAFT_157 [Xylaria acuta]